MIHADVERRDGGVITKLWVRGRDKRIGGGTRVTMPPSERRPKRAEEGSKHSKRAQRPTTTRSSLRSPDRSTRSNSHTSGPDCHAALACLPG